MHRLGGRAVVGMSLLSAPCLANGRYPAADQLVIDPGDPAHLLLRATFGLLQSQDGGQSWSWICEEAVGYTGDPSVAVLRGGSVVAAFVDFVSVSQPGGCGWTRKRLPAPYRYVFDATLDAADPGRAWLLAGSLDGALQVGLSRVDASGSLDEPIPVAVGVVPVTVEVAPSAPDRIYVSGVLEGGGAVVLRSSDRGLTWQRFAVGGATGPLFVSAVDPADPDRVYARVDGGAPGSLPAADGDRSDHVVVSDDGAETWRTVLSLDADLLGFALSPDGTSVAVGAPGLGVYVASTSDLVFQPAAKVTVPRCLRWTGDGLFACGQENLDGWTLARSGDGGQSFEAVWHQQALRPLDCSASGSGGSCRLAWPDIARSIQADPTFEVAPREPSATNATAGDGAPGGPIVPSAASDASSRDGAGCGLTPRARAPGWAPLMALMAVMACRARRRRGGR
jgi:hypothetical protein